MKFYFILLAALFAHIKVFAQPANDECSNAIAVSVNAGSFCMSGTTESTLAGATPSTQASACFGQAVNDVWFSFTATAPKHRLTVTGGFTNDPLVYAIYAGSCSGEQVDCHSVEAWNTRLITGLTAGQQYYIRFYKPAFVSGNLFSFCITSADNPIEVETGLNASGLVENFLITMPVAEFDNVTYSTGSNFGEQNGIGSFYAGSLWNMDIYNGVILSTGDVTAAPGPNNSFQNAGSASWPGDDDLEAVLFAIDGPVQTYNATALEFDFSPVADYIAFDVMFASESYGEGQCQEQDGFAILLTDLTDQGNPVNLAVIPGTTQPIAVNTVRNSINNANCTSQNEEYFDELYYDGDLFSATNFNGTTVRFQINAPVVPGHQYHIKYVIADAGTPGADSALFIGEWDYSMFIIPNTGSIILCEGETATLTSPQPGTSYSWSQDGINTGQTASAILINEPGTYTVNVMADSGDIEQYSFVVYQAGTNDMITDGNICVDHITGEVIEPYHMDTNFSDQPYAFTWSFDGVVVPEVTGPSFDAIFPGVYHVTAYHPEAGCFVDDEIVVGQSSIAAPVGQGYTISGDTLSINVEGSGTYLYQLDNGEAQASNIFTGVSTGLHTVTINDANGCGSLIMSVDISLDTDQMLYNGLKVYPNPFNDLLTISSYNAVNSVIIYNLLGQAVYENATNGTEVRADLAKLANGVYLVKIKSGGQENIFKVVKD